MAGYFGGFPSFGMPSMGGPSFGFPSLGAWPGQQPAMNPMMTTNSIYASMPSMPSVPAAASKKSSAAPYAPSIYSSMLNVPSSSMYASQSAAPFASMYASMPVAPTVSAPPMKPPVKEDFPALPSGYSTVGLMLWPGKNGELLVTGWMEGHSAETCGLETGDVIIKVDDMFVEGMAASDVAGRMSGPTGSSVAVTVTRTTKTTNDNGTVSTTKSTHTAVIIRDVSSDEANKKQQESLESLTGTLDSQTGTSQSSARPMTPAECFQFGVPIGSTWGPSVNKVSAPVPKVKPRTAAAAPKPKPAPKPAPQPANAATAGESRLLTHQECMQWGVPYGSRLAPPKSKA